MKAFILLVFLSCFTIAGFTQKSGIEISGDVIQIALPVAAVTSTFIWKDEKTPTLQFIKTMGTSFIMTQSLKWIINKPRPNGGEHGFPSGHTSAAFTGAAFLERRFGWGVGIPAYVLAGYVGWTRVDANKHDYWDLLGGAIVGVGSAYLFTKPYEGKKVKITLRKYSEAVLVAVVIKLE